MQLVFPVAKLVPNLATSCINGRTKIMRKDAYCGCDPSGRLPKPTGTHGFTSVDGAYVLLCGTNTVRPVMIPKDSGDGDEDVELARQLLYAAGHTHATLHHHASTCFKLNHSMANRDVPNISFLNGTVPFFDTSTVGITLRLRGASHKSKASGNVETHGQYSRLPTVFLICPPRFKRNCCFLFPASGLHLDNRILTSQEA